MDLGTDAQSPCFLSCVSFRCVFYLDETVCFLQKAVCSRHFVTVTEARLIHLPHEASRVLPFPGDSPIPSHSTRLSSVGDFCRSLSLLPRRVLPAVLTLVTCLSRLTLMPGLSSVNMAIKSLPWGRHISPHKPQPLLR